MDIQVKELDYCKLAVVYQADAEQILNKRSEVLGHFKKAPVPGFRQGKATSEAIKHHYKDQINESVKRGLTEDAYHDTLFEKKLKAHGAPRINSVLLEDGKFTCEFEMYTKPEFTLSQYKGLTLPKPSEGEITALELTEQMIQELRVRAGEVVPFSENDVIQNGDNIIVDYEGTIDGDRVENLCAVGEMMTVGHSQLKEFDDNLIGLSVGDSKEFTITVPTTGLPSLAGKTITFKVTCNMGSKKVPCPLDDALAQKYNKKDYTEFREHVYGVAVAKAQEQSRANKAQAIANKLVADNEFQVPNWIALSEAQYLAHQSHLNWDKMPDSDKVKFMEIAEKNSRLSLILDKIREEEPEAQLSDQEIFDMIKQNILNSKNKSSPDDVIKEMSRTGYLQILFSRIKDEHVLDFVVKSTTFTE